MLSYLLRLLDPRTLVCHASLPLYVLFHLLGRSFPLLCTCLTSPSLIFCFHIIPSEILSTTVHLFLLTSVLL